MVELWNCAVLYKVVGYASFNENNAIYNSFCVGIPEVVANFVILNGTLRILLHL